MLGLVAYWAEQRREATKPPAPIDPPKMAHERFVAIEYEDDHGKVVRLEGLARNYGVEMIAPPLLEITGWGDMCRRFASSTDGPSLKFTADAVRGGRVVELGEVSEFYKGRHE